MTTPTQAQQEDWIKKRAAIRANAIERCAQALDGVPTTKGGMIYKSQAAAAIRALKDKP